MSYSDMLFGLGVGLLANPLKCGNFERPYNIRIPPSCQTGDLKHGHRQIVESDVEIKDYTGTYVYRKRREHFVGGGGGSGLNAGSFGNSSVNHADDYVRESFQKFLKNFAIPEELEEQMKSKWLTGCVAYLDFKGTWVIKNEKFIDIANPTLLVIQGGRGEACIPNQSLGESSEGSQGSRLCFDFTGLNYITAGDVLYLNNKSTLKGESFGYGGYLIGGQPYEHFGTPADPFFHYTEGEGGNGGKSFGLSYNNEIVAIASGGSGGFGHYDSLYNYEARSRFFGRHDVPVWSRYTIYGNTHESMFYHASNSSNIILIIKGFLNGVTRQLSDNDVTLNLLYHIVWESGEESSFNKSIKPLHIGDNSECLVIDDTLLSSYIVTGSVRRKIKEVRCDVNSSHAFTNSTIEIRLCGVDDLNHLPIPKSVEFNDSVYIDDDFNTERSRAGSDIIAISDNILTSDWFIAVKEGYKEPSYIIDVTDDVNLSDSFEAIRLEIASNILTDNVLSDDTFIINKYYFGKKSEIVFAFDYICSNELYYNSKIFNFDSTGIDGVGTVELTDVQKVLNNNLYKV